jgi:hypothetical protein
MADLKTGVMGGEAGGERVAVDVGEVWGKCPWVFCVGDGEVAVGWCARGGVRVIGEWRW